MVMELWHKSTQWREQFNYLDDEDVPQIDQEILEKVSVDLKTQLTVHDCTIC